ncbi:PRPF19 isoform 3, partial [Pan troglodytes]
YWAFSDIQTGRVLTKVTDETSGCSLTCAQFHPDGLIFGTGTMDSQIKIWDLKVKSLIFDQSGTYLALGGTDVQIYICKQWTEILHFTEHSGLTTGVAFGHHAKFIASTGMDRSLKFYSL